ncbi:hypothetical protein SB781_36505, partial [Paraburkholderia sp. SIMBA_061]
MTFFITFLTLPNSFIRFTLLKLGEVYKNGQSDAIPQLGTYHLFHDKSHAYLSTCISSQGESTTTMGDFVYKMNRNLLK